MKHIDKLYHLLVGLALTLLFTYLWADPIITFTLVYLIAFAKEIRDEVVYGGFDIWDLLVTLLPLTLLLL